VKLIFTYFTG